MEEKGKKVIQISLTQFIIIIVLLIIVIGLAIGLYVNLLKNSKTDSEMQALNENGIQVNEKLNNENSVDNEQANNDKEIASATAGENETKGIRYNKDFEDMLVEYILNSIEEYAKNGSILKSTSGDVTAEKLKGEEVNSNSQRYKEKIMEMLTDKDLFGDIYNVNNKDACKYNFEKILNRLGLSTHMGAGVGEMDTLGKKVYVYGKTEIDITTQPSGN